MEVKQAPNTLPKHIKETESVINKQSEFNASLLQNMNNRLRAKLTLITRRQKVLHSNINMWPGEIKSGQEER